MYSIWLYVKYLAAQVPFLVDIIDSRIDHAEMKDPKQPAPDLVEIVGGLESIKRRE